MTDRTGPFYPRVGIVKCRECGLVYFDGSVDPRALYTSDYFNGGEYLDYHADKPIIQRNFRARIAHLAKLAPRGKLLEIGSAYGFFLELAREKWEVQGIEISPEGVAHARDKLGLDVRAEDFLQAPEEPESFDLVCMWDTIEHLSSPMEHIEKAARWLKPGGYLVLSTGDIASLVSRIQRDRWRLVHPPTHLFYFSPDTLGRAVCRAGLEVAEVSHIGYSRSSKTMAYGMFMLGARRLPGLYSLATLGGRLDIPVYLNLRNIMMLVARKPPAKG